MTIGHLVDNLDDVKYIMEHMSPLVIELFENAFVKTNYCQEANHAFMKEEQYRQKIGSFAMNSPVINEEMINKKMGKLSESEGHSEDEIYRDMAQRAVT